MLSLCMSLVSGSAEDGYSDLPDVLSEGDMETWVSETLPESAGEGAEWYVIALLQGNNGNEYDFSKYAASLTAYFSNNRIPGAVEKQRIALTMLALGLDSEIPETVAAETIGEQGIMSWVFGLHLVQNGAEGAKYSEQEIVEQLLECRLADGGWAITGEYADVDVTAMVLQALAGQRALCEEAIDRGLALLSEKQQEDGGYKSYGVPNAESSCQVIIALTALGIDPNTDERFIKNGKTVPDALAQYRLADGSFSHTIGGQRNGYACQQALLAGTALWRYENGKGGLYTFEKKESVPPAADGSEKSSEAVSETIPSETEKSISAPSEEEGLTPLRMTVLVIAVAVAVGSLAYLIFGKNGS